MERSHGEEGVEGKCRKDKGHDLWYRPVPLAEFRRIPMCCLSCRSRQQQHLLQWLQWPPCELNISCTSTTAESRAKIWYQ